MLGGYSDSKEEASVFQPSLFAYWRGAFSKLAASVLLEHNAKSSSSSWANVQLLIHGSNKFYSTSFFAEIREPPKFCRGVDHCRPVSTKETKAISVLNKRCAS